MGHRITQTKNHESYEATNKNLVHEDSCPFLFWFLIGADLCPICGKERLKLISVAYVVGFRAQPIGFIGSPVTIGPASIASCFARSAGSGKRSPIFFAGMPATMA